MSRNTLIWQPLMKSKKNDYNLNIPRYVDTFEEEEPIDMVHVGNDIKKIRQEQQVLEKELFRSYLFPANNT